MERTAYGGALSRFHPLVARWFGERFGTALEIQENAWAEISSGRNVLISAPTGSGKTLAAFLWSLNGLITGLLPPGKTRVLYISPLRALNSDVRRNLLIPLEEIARLFQREGEWFPDINVLTRSGDTPQAERRRMIKRPPEILITTPESLNLILSSPKAREILRDVATVIIDEIHAVLSSKRGTHLITAVDRVCLFASGIQRIALSATIKPLKEAAAFVGGYTVTVKSGEHVYRRRPVRILCSEWSKAVEVSVRLPEKKDTEIWNSLADELKRIVKGNRSTLTFTNTRRLSEKLAALINEGEGAQIAYSHHGSLSREIRRVVEERMKRGLLRAVVATSSLELGIDIGELDEVILVGTPPSVSSGLQRIGRAGHRVNLVTRGRIYPTHGRDTLDAAVMARCIVQGDIEEQKPVLCPLDVLAQVLVSMTGVEKWDIDELFWSIKTSYPFHRLSRREFNLVLEMLAGRYEKSRIRELSPRVSLDRIENKIQGRAGVLSIIYHSGGTIPDRGYFDLRLEGSGARIGELDEEFVWERSPGDSFGLGAQRWKITGINHQTVTVVPWEGEMNSLVFWKAEKPNRDFHFCDKVLEFLEHWNRKIETPEFRRELKENYYLEDGTVENLVRFLRAQCEVTGSPDLPHRHHVLVERCRGFSGGKRGEERVILHTLWGNRINQPFSIALQAVWENRYGTHLEVFSDDDCVMILLAGESDIFDLLKAVYAGELEQLLRKKLEKTGFFSARFRENAAVSLLLPRGNFKRRMPLWLNRLRAKRLFDAVLAYEDFPILLETWRTCLIDEFDFESLRTLIEEMHEGIIRISQVYTRAPSPFAQGIAFRQTEKHMYSGDEPFSPRSSALSEEIMREVVLSASLRPEIERSLVENFQDKLQRTFHGYPPRSSVELLDWVKERTLIQTGEWEHLLCAAERDWDLSRGELLENLLGKLVKVRLPHTEGFSVTAVESLPKLLSALCIDIEKIKISPIDKGGIEGKVLDDVLKKLTFATGLENEEDSSARIDLSEMVGEWLRFYGPVDPKLITETFGIDERRTTEIMEILSEKGDALIDVLIKGQGTFKICETRNLERLLAIQRRARRPSLKPLPVQDLGLFLAAYHGLTESKETGRDLKPVFERLFGYPAPANMWESEILPARFREYRSSFLDALLAETELSWIGCGRGRVCFCFASDFDLFIKQHSGDVELMEKIFPDMIGSYSFGEVYRYSGMSSDELERNIWNLVWRSRLSSRSFDIMRRGIRHKDTGAGRRRGWGVSHPYSESFYPVQLEKTDMDELDAQETCKELIRQLLLRYGVVFRELLERELPHMRWPGLFRTLRIMELGGQVISGYFFEGIRGVQFASESAFSLLKNWEPAHPIYWMNACDPVSICGLKLEGLGYRLPRRVPTTHLVYHGKTPALISRMRGKSLEFLVKPDDPAIPEYLYLFNILSTREFLPLRSVKVEMVNGIRVSQSPYRERLLSYGFKRHPGGLIWHPEYATRGDEPTA